MTILILSLHQFSIAGKSQVDGLPVADGLLLCGVQVSGRHRSQGRLRRQQGRLEVPLGLEALQLIQRMAVRQGKRAAFQTTQGPEVCSAAQRVSQIVRQTADVGAGRAANVQGEVGRLPGDDLQGINVDGTCLAFDLLALSRQIVEPPPLDPDCGVHRGNLLDWASKVNQGSFDRRTVDVDGKPVDRLTLCVVRSRGLAQSDYAEIPLGMGRRETG